MSLYDKIKNIYGKNNEEELIKSISNVKEKLNGLVEERMCKVYSGFLMEELNNNHVPARLVNTLDLGFEYEHVFILVPSNDIGYFLVDLTFSQFNSKVGEFSYLLVNGYQLIDDISLNRYLYIVSNGSFINKFSIEDIFYSVQSSNQDLEKFKR